MSTSARRLARDVGKSAAVRVTIYSGERSPRRPGDGALNIANSLPGCFPVEITEITETNQGFEIRSAPISLTASLAALPSMSLNPVRSILSVLRVLRG